MRKLFKRLLFLTFRGYKSFSNSGTASIARTLAAPCCRNECEKGRRTARWLCAWNRSQSGGCKSKRRWSQSSSVQSATLTPFDSSPRWNLDSLAACFSCSVASDIDKRFSSSGENAVCASTRFWTSALISTGCFWWIKPSKASWQSQHTLQTLWLASKSLTSSTFTCHAKTRSIAKSKRTKRKDDNRMQ